MIRLSKEFANRLKLLIDMAADDRAKVATALGQLLPAFEVEEDISAAIKKSGITDAKQAEEYQRAVMGLVYLQANSTDSKQDEFLGDVVDAIVRARGDAGTDEAKAVSKSALAELLTKPLSVSAKASVLLLDSERGFSRAKIISDIRPVFGQDVSSPDIEAVFIVHTLQISYHGNEEGEFFLSLSTSDVKRLRAVIDRALEKAEGLAKVVPQLTKNFLQST
jgi:hypothetical protein